MQTIPNLNTSFKNPFLELEIKCLEQQEQIEAWFSNKWTKHQVPFYGSVDLRNSGFKLTPVDMNLYPGGFNNLNPEFEPLAIKAIKAFLQTNYPNCNKILLIPENHTRNLPYLSNVYALLNVFKHAGVTIELGLTLADMPDSMVVETAQKQQLTYNRLIREGKQIKTSSGFIPDLIILNNDLTSGIPDILKGIDQVVIPELNAGWYMRKKTNFFSQYDLVSEEFANLIGIDSWLINPYFCTAQVDFENKIGLEELAIKVEAILNKIELKYDAQNISETPYVIVKANNGTYGRGIMVVKSAQEIREINRKSRNKMAVIKEGIGVDEVIIQEGVHTFEEVGGNAAEPVIYMLNTCVIGGFYRVHPERGIFENLNAPGANFTPLQFNCPTHADPKHKPDCQINRFYTYGVIARLSLLAASYELNLFK